MQDRKNIPLSREEIPRMARAGKFAARALEHIGPFIQPGMKTIEIDQIIHDYVLSRGAKSATVGYFGWKWASCTSLNDVICHGVPNDTVVNNGDILNVDITIILDGFFGDTSKTFLIGNVPENAKRLVGAAHMAMARGIEAITPNGFTGDIGFEIQKFTNRQGFHTVKEIGGHGIGRGFHLDPFVPSFGKKGRGDILLPFTCITVEPMINEKNCEMIELEVPGSTIKEFRTADKSLSAQFEHTVLITDTGYEILTVP